jgi:hypothetical protein
MPDRQSTAHGGSTATEDTDTFLRTLSDIARAGIAAKAPCGWCGVNCGNAEHDRLYRMSETTWREMAA